MKRLCARWRAPVFSAQRRPMVFVPLALMLLSAAAATAFSDCAYAVVL